MNKSRYRIDLAEHPSRQWNKLIKDYKHSILVIIDWYKKKKRNNLLLYTGIECGLKILNSEQMIMYGKELTAIAEQLGVNEGIVIALQFIYETCACCTSVITNKNELGAIHHFRTMDWEMNELKDLTVIIDAYNGDNFLFSAVTWAGYIGILTGMTKKYSIAVNFRSGDVTLLDNLKHAQADRWPIGYLVRDILSKQGLTYKEAVNILSNAELIAPTYFSIAGTNRLEGVIITRSPISVISKCELSNEWFLIQTNIDQEKLTDNKTNNMLKSKERYNIVNKYLNNLQEHAIGESELKAIGFLKYVNNDTTIYKVYMCPSEGIIEMI